MECGWYAYQPKTGETLFFFNKLTGQYKWISCSCSRNLDPISNQPWVLDNDTFKVPITTEAVEEPNKPNNSGTCVKVRSIAVGTDFPSAVKTFNTQGTQTECLDDLSCANDGLAQGALSSLIQRSNKSQNMFSGEELPNSIKPSLVEEKSCGNLPHFPKQSMMLASNKVKLHECSYCEKAFTSYVFLVRHEKYHVENNSQKKVCDESSKTRTEEHTSSLLKKSIENNLMNFQNIERKEVDRSNCSFKCVSCQMLFKLWDKLVEHQEVSQHKGTEYQCDRCGQHYNMFSDMQRHQLKDHCPDNQFTNSRFPNNNDFQKNPNQQEELIENGNSIPVHTVQYKNDGRYWCYKCDISYIWPHDLVKHKIKKRCCQDKPIMRKGHNGINYICRYCDKVFTERQMFVAHHMKHFRRQSPYKCDECSKTFLTTKSYVKHYAFHLDSLQKDKVVQKQHACEFCSKSFDKIKYLRKHIKRKHTTKDEPPKMLNCDICNKFFMSQNSLSKHKRVHFTKNEASHNETEPNTSVSTTKEEDNTLHKFECSQCKRKYSSLKSLRRHQKLLKHRSTFFFKSSHVSTNNLRSKTRVCYQCQVCKKSFQHYNVFYKHRSAHRGKKAGRCNMCGKIFKANKMLANNTCISCKEASNKAQKGFSCEVCDKVFLEKKSLNNHIRIHKTAHFECGSCNIVFVSAERLNRHLKNHPKNKPKTYHLLKEKRHECNRCGKLYTGRGNLLRHQRRCNELENKKDEKWQYFKCIKCNKTFSKFSDLYNHFSVHGEEKPCCKCNKILSSSGNLKRHLFEMHKEDHTFYCHVCSQTFHDFSSLRDHTSLVPGVKKHKCKECDQAFSLCGGLMEHSKVHSKG